MRYITETRNLFDISKVTETDKLKVIGNSIYSYNYPVNTNATSTLSIFKSLKPNTNYTISAVCPYYLDRATNVIALVFNNDDFFWLFENYRTGLGQNTFSLTQEQIDNIKSVYFYGLPEEEGGPIIWSNIQIEEGDTATPYVPYRYLPMRRMKYKVSNVCQLLDKSKYPATQTINGVTFTNNGDGSYAVSGRSTGDFSYLNLINNFKLKKDHIYLNGGNNISYCYVETVFIDANINSHWVDRYKADSNSTVRIGLIRPGSAEDIVTLFPQFFDLTEMYGAGNEPTTVEQFRQDFPEEMYDYTPYCWAFMKNIRYLDTTKNLFDYSKVNNLMYIGGFSVNQYFIKNGNKFTVTYPMSKGATYLDYIMPLKAGTYTLSLLAYGTVSGATKGFFGLVKVENDYKVLRYNKYAKSWLSGNDRQSYTLTIEEDGNYAVYAYSDYADSTNLDSTFWDIQLELGDTATNYVPYGYLPLK